MKLRIKDFRKVKHKKRELEESKLKKIYFSLFGNQEEIRMKTDKELEQELRKGVIEIPASIFNEYFILNEKEESKQEFEIRQESFDISGKYTHINVSFESFLKVQVKPPKEFSMKVWIFASMRRAFILQQEIDENTKEFVKLEFLPILNDIEYVTILVELPPEYENTEGLKLDIEIEIVKNKQFKIKSIVYLEKYSFSPRLLEEPKGNCLLCGDIFDKTKEIIIDEKKHCYHQSCFSYMRCCQCKTKKQYKYLQYDDELQGFVCEVCFPSLFEN